MFLSMHRIFKAVSAIRFVLGLSFLFIIINLSAITGWKVSFSHTYYSFTHASVVLQFFAPVFLLLGVSIKDHFRKDPVTCIRIFIVLILATFIFLRPFWVSDEKPMLWSFMASMIFLSAWMCWPGVYSMTLKSRRAVYLVILLGLVLVSILYLPLFAKTYEFCKTGCEKPWFNQLPSIHNMRNFALMLCLAVSFIGGHIYSRKINAAWQIASYIFLTLMIAIIMWSGSRAAVFGISIALFSVPVLFGIASKMNTLLVLLSYISGSIVSFLIPRPDLSFGFWQRMLEISGPMENGRLGSGRIEDWKYAIDQILSHPLDGIGYTYIYFQTLGSRDIYLHVHNFIIDAILSWGIPIGGGLVIALLFILWNAMKTAHCLARTQERTDMHAPIALLVSFCFTAMLTPITLYGHLMVFPIICLAYIGAIQKITAQQEDVS